MNEINKLPITCSGYKCLFLRHYNHYDGPCSVANYLFYNKGPKLDPCPCEFCILRPMCKRRCKERREYIRYLINHLPGNQFLSPITIEGVVCYDIPM